MTTTKRRHYSVRKLEEEYSNTYGKMIKLGALVILFGLVYFFAMLIYLGQTGQTKYAPFVEQFGDEVELEYGGSRVPEADIQKGIEAGQK